MREAREVGLFFAFDEHDDWTVSALHGVEVPIGANAGTQIDCIGSHAANRIRHVGGGDASRQKNRHLRERLQESAAKFPVMHSSGSAKFAYRRGWPSGVEEDRIHLRC